MSKADTLAKLVSADGPLNDGTITASEVGALPIGGGTLTGNVTFAAGQTWPTFNQNTTGTANNVTGTVAVANGGTGQTSLTANNVVLGNGTSAVNFVAPGTSGNVLTSNGTTWISSVPTAGGLTYIYTTTSVTASDKQGILADTSGGPLTVTLPATPATGAQVVVADAGNSWAANNLTVARNSSTIGGLSANLVCNVSGVSVQFVYDGFTWEVYSQFGGNGTVVSAPQINATNGIIVSSAAITANYAIPSGSNALSAGPVTINSGITVTVSSGSVWTVV
jgi:hypothetical protein